MRASHTLDIYETELHVATTKRDWAALRRKLTFLGDPDGTVGLTCTATHVRPGQPPRYVVAFWINASRHSTQGLVQTCSHEAAHGAGSIMNYIEHDSGGGIDEPYAYLVGWLTGWLFEHTHTELQA